MAHKQTYRAAFTPGPWMMAAWRSGWNILGTNRASGQAITVAAVYELPVGKESIATAEEEEKANAALISQAPELFAALRQMVDDAEDRGKKTEFRGFVTQSSINRAKRALLAADGGQR